MERIYNWLVRLYPATFRERYQAAIERQFRDEYRDAATGAERALLSIRALRDLAASIPAELARELAQDLKYSFRLYRKRRMTAAIAVAALALSIGASTGVFTVLNALLLRGLPFRNPDELVELRNSPFTAGLGRAGFREWTGRSAWLADAATFSSSEMNLAVKNSAVRVRVTETSANFPDLLGMQPVGGRIFALDEDKPGSTAVAIISHGLWRQVFGGEPAIAGTSIAVNGSPLTIIGVAPPQFDYPGKTDLWVPSAFNFESIPRRGAFAFQTIGRLKSDTSPERARALFDTEVRRLAPQLDAANRPAVVSLRDELAGPVSRAAQVLAALILFVLLTACGNLAHLLLSRFSERRGELAMRTALGASRARLIQQLVTEALTLTVSGAGLGLLLAYWLCRVAASVAPPAIASQAYTILDWRVVGFAALLAVVTGVFFGVCPMVLADRMKPARRIRFAVLACQACVTLVLLATSITLSRTFLQILGTDLGLTTANAVTMTVSLQGTKHRTPAAERRYYDEALERLRSTPGVQAAGAVGYLPLATNIYMAGKLTLDSGQAVGPIVMNAATDEYFRAVGTKLLAGSDFAPVGSEPVVIVNEAFAQAAGVGPSIVGRKILAPWSKTPYRITGVVETTRFGGPSQPGLPMIYWRNDEEPPPNLTLVARVSGDPEAALAKCRDVLRAVDPQVAIYDVRTLEQRLRDLLARPRFFTGAALFLSGLALLLAIAGIFGTAAQAVSQRSREIGIRMALGAPHTRLRTALLQDTVMPVVLGAMAGVAVAALAGACLEYLIESARSIGAWTTVAAAGMLLLAALAAGWRATAGVMSIDPADAIRCQ